MILSYNPKFIFIHIPKTAGTTVQTILKPHIKGDVQYGSQKSDLSYHTTALEFKNLLKEDYDNFFKFTIVRNPYDRLYSWCSMLCGKKQMITQERFKRWLYENSSAKLPQLNWYQDQYGKDLVDYVGRFEELKVCLREICMRMKLQQNNDIENTHARKSLRHSDYKLIYDKEMIDFVYAYHRYEIDRFKYSFE